MNKKENIDPTQSLNDRLLKRYKLSRSIANKLIETSSEEDKDYLEAWRQASPENEQEFGRIVQRLKKDIHNKQASVGQLEWDAFEKRGERFRIIRGIKYYVAAILVGVFISVGVLYDWHLTSPTDIPATGMKEHKATLVLNDGSRVYITDTVEQGLPLPKGTEIKNSGKVLAYDERKDSNEIKVEYNTLIVPRGGEYELVLSDGTHVWLNSESKLVYPVRFTGDTREVEMVGEMCFQVMKNKNVPFIVKVNEVSVKVLGTLFNVEAYPGEDHVTTTLAEGRVSVSDGRESLEIVPNQQVVIREGEFLLREVDARGILSWTSNVCFFTETSLKDIMSKLARWYDVEVFFATPSLKEAHFSLEIQRYENIIEILSKIEKTGRVKFKVNGKIVIVE